MSVEVVEPGKEQGAAPVILRDTKGRWLPGTKSPSGGGYRWKKTQLAQDLIEAKSVEIVQAVINKALEGDVSALKLVLDRLIPIRKSAPVMIDLPPVTNSEDAKQALSILISLQSTGEITSDEAEGFIKTLEAYINVSAVADLEAKVNALCEQVA